MKAKDIMKTEVITVSPDTTVEELGRLFIEKGISGAPVMESGRLFGIVTENDLIRKNTRFHIPTLVRLFDAFIPIKGPASMEEEIKRMSASRVGEICTKEVITVDSEASLQDVATIMTENNVHLLPVTDSGRLVGILGKMDLIRGILGEADEQKP